MLVLLAQLLAALLTGLVLLALLLAALLTGLVLSTLLLLASAALQCPLCAKSGHSLIAGHFRFHMERADS
jgi:hypothetical protein